MSHDTYIEIEAQLVTEEGNGINYGPNLQWHPKFNQGTWRVTIEHSKGFRDYRIRARHQETGAKLDPRHRKSLGKARDEAGRAATVLRGTMYDYDWRSEAKLNRLLDPVSPPTAH